MDKSIIKKSLPYKVLTKFPQVKNLDKIRNKFFVFDCETFDRDARPESFAFCCMYGLNYKKVFHTIDDFKAELFSGAFRNKYIFCHWGEFDLNIIFDNIKKSLDREAIFNGSRFIIASKEKVLFADSTNIYPGTKVKQLGEILGIEKMEMDDRFGKGKRFKVTDKEIEYCYRDCEIVWLALEKIFTTVQSVRPTLASLSLLYYQRFYMPFNFAYNKLSIRFFDSYYGGRVEAFYIGQTNSHKYDINSMYPYVMTYATFPNPKFVTKSQSKDVKSLMYDLKYYEGQATIKVKHKKNMFGFLPTKKNSKLVFPNGTFSGTWCFPEIRMALKYKAIEILEVQEVLCSYPMESPFKKFATELYQKRLTATGIEKTNLKLILNSLYGKWGQREKFKEIYFDKMPLDFIDLLIEKKIAYEIKTFNKDREDCYIHIFSPIKTNADYTKITIDPHGFKTKIHSIPVFSSYITSYARCYLQENMLKYKKYSITYTDTDCIAAEKEIPIKDSMELGEFKKEKEMLMAIYGNKNYEELKDNKVHRKIKGIPKSAQNLADTYNIAKRAVNTKDSYEYTTMVKTKRAIRQQKTAGVWELTTKSLTNNYTKRTVLKNGRTLPLWLSE